MELEKSFGVVGWILRLHDRVVWHAVMNTAVNFSFMKDDFLNQLLLTKNFIPYSYFLEMSKVDIPERIARHQLHAPCRGELVQVVGRRWSAL
jgi:hypothetical protein